MKNGLFASRWAIVFFWHALCLLPVNAAGVNLKENAFDPSISCNLACSPGSSQSIKFHPNKIDTLLGYLRDPTSSYVLVVAHRADWRNAPENSVAAIEKAADMGVDMVEIDVQRTKDGDFVLMHDGNIDRTTNGKGSVRDFTVDQLKRFRLRCSDGTLSNEQVPTLREALATCKRWQILVNIDKGGDYLSDILPIIKATGTENQVILKGSNTVEAVKNMLGFNSGIIFMPVVNLDHPGSVAYVNSFLENYKPCAIEVIFNSADFPELAYTQNIVEAGARVWINALWASLCGGHEDEKAMTNPDANWGWILENHASIIQTDRPKELLEYLTRKGLRGTKKGAPNVECGIAYSF